MTPEQVLAGLQDEMRGLSEKVQRLASENETLRSQSTVGAVRTVTMANEEEYSDWEFVLTCFVGKMDGMMLTELRAVAANLRVKRVPTDESGEREGENALQYSGTVDDEGTAKNGARGTRPKRV